MNERDVTPSSEQNFPTFERKTDGPQQSLRLYLSQLSQSAQKKTTTMGRDLNHMALKRGCSRVVSCGKNDFYAQLCASKKTDINYKSTCSLSASDIY